MLSSVILLLALASWLILKLIQKNIGFKSKSLELKPTCDHTPILLHESHGDVNALYYLIYQPNIEGFTVMCWESNVTKELIQK